MEILLPVLGDLLTPSILIICAIGAIIGVVLGAIPGLSGGLAIALLLPITFTMEPIVAIPLLMTIFVGSMSGSFIGAILLGIPGTPSSVATVFDGYEITKKGNPVKALSAGVASSSIGIIPSLIIAMFLSPIIASFAVKLGPWEFFSLAVVAILMVVSLSKGNLSKGLLSAGIAIAITSVGTDPLSGVTQRFTFGNFYLSSGFSLIPVMLGLFAGSIILLEYAEGAKSSDSNKVKVSRFKWPGKALIKNIRNVIQSFFIGLWIGILPGLGGSLSNLMAYATAKNTSKHPEKFGKGTIDGVIAPETANNASLGGSLIPFISLGIPGDTVTALLIGALTIQGVEAGPLIFTNSPDIVYMIFAAAIIGAILVVVFQIFAMPLFPMILRIPYHYLYPVIFVVCLTGAYLSSNNLFDVFVTLGFTLLGVFMAYMKLPVGPFILTFVLASLLETNLRKGVSYEGYFSFFTHPISLIFLIIAVVSTLYPIVKDHFKKVHQ